MKTFLKYKGDDRGLSYAIDDMLYLVEKDKILSTDFAYSMVNTLSDCKESDISKIKVLFEHLKVVSGYYNIIEETGKVLKMYPQLIENFTCDNPKFCDIMQEILN